MSSTADADTDANADADTDTDTPTLTNYPAQTRGTEVWGMGIGEEEVGWGVRNETFFIPYSKILLTASQQACMARRQMF